jgi:hypothetical protein
MFDENSGLVKIWVRLLSHSNGKYTIDNVPNIENLREVVESVMNK